MRRICITLAVASVLAIASPAFGAGPERYEDTIGDADGDAPDIVAVSVSQPEDGSTIRFEVELAPQRPFGSDMETWTDVLFIAMSGVPEVDDRGILSGDDYVTGTHGATIAMQEQTGAMLVTPTGMYYYVVDVDAEGESIAFTFDRKLIGSPSELYWQVLLGVEREGAVEGDEMEGDVYPDDGEPPAHYRIGGAGW